MNYTEQEDFEDSGLSESDRGIHPVNLSEARQAIFRGKFQVDEQTAGLLYGFLLRRVARLEGILDKQNEMLGNFFADTKMKIRDINADKRIPPNRRTANIQVNAPLALEQQGWETKRATLLAVLRALGHPPEMEEGLMPDWIGTKASD